jgi:chromosome segregation protein
MDKGAHYHRCDFQVHTPRDIGWKGDKPISGKDRDDLASRLIAYCRSHGIQAIAVTDHHDLRFFTHFKKAAAAETDATGLALPVENRTVVFPGVELTLGTPPCQAILILDAAFPEDQFARILNKLAIHPSDNSAPSTALVEPISSDVVADLEDLYTKLDSVDVLKGKYIVLPHVGDGGHKTLLRAGFAEYYKKMPCVGGYLDGSIDKLGEGNLRILGGSDVNYGDKALGLFQTSDNRKESFEDLGKFTTWVKWAQPTAEALRQACLARQSRLSQKDPILPGVYITKIDVTNCRFLGSFSLELNKQYNALIGGRGTGKSTILEYIRWALCDQPSSVVEEEQSEVEARRKVLIEKTLTAFGGEVRIAFVLNGIEHVVKRDSKSGETLLKIGSANFTKVKEEEVQRILPIQAYSQKQLSSVGIRIEELNRFVQLPIADQLYGLRHQISDAAKRLRATYAEVTRKRQAKIELSQFELEIQSLKDQAASMRGALRGISAEDQTTISQKQVLDTEQSLITKAQTEFVTATSKINELAASLKRYPDPFTKHDALVNEKLIGRIDSMRKEKFAQIGAIILQLREAVSETSMAEYDKLIREWNDRRTEHEKRYEEAKSRASANQAQLDEIRRIELRLAELTKFSEDRNTLIRDLGEPEEAHRQNTADWYSLHQAKRDLLNEQAKQFTQYSNGLIKADVTRLIDTSSIKAALMSALYGTRIREDRIDALCGTIEQSPDPLATWKVIVEELRTLCEIGTCDEKNPVLPDTPTLAEAEFLVSHRSKIADTLCPEGWLNIATLELEFHPEFRYSTNNQMGDEIPFSEASAGQQATALLTVLLSQCGSPLIIDQPEDDIDNRAIETVIESIWNAKTKRQLIFTSHNANLVVNGDAELVVCCDYREASSQTRGKIKEEGAIDDKAIRNEITAVMEGGEKAFLLRKQKYGF